MRKLTCEPTTEIRGDVLLSLLENVQAHDLQSYVARYGLSDVQEGEWYRMKPFLDLLNALGEETNQSPNLVAIGMSVAETAYMPPEMGVPTFEDFLMHWDEHYQSNHRNGDIGYKVVEKLGQNLYQATIYDGLYPDDFEYGVLYGFARRFLPEGSFFVIRYDDEVRHLDQGGEKTVYIIEWE